jgi:hypothetical protein
MPLVKIVEGTFVTDIRGCHKPLVTLQFNEITPAADIVSFYVFFPLN